jgi:hypothetical protein
MAFCFVEGALGLTYYTNGPLIPPQLYVYIAAIVQELFTHGLSGSAAAPVFTVGKPHRKSRE